MAKTRLNMTHRDAIISVLERDIKEKSFPDELKNIKALQRKVNRRAILLLQKQADAEEISILHKFGCTKKTDEIRFVHYDNANGTSTFEIKLDTQNIVVRDPGTWNSRHHAIQLEETDNLYVWYKQLKSASEDFNTKVHQTVIKYKSFVRDCRYWEDLIEHLPELKEAEELIVGQKVTALADPSIVRDVKADAAKRAGKKVAATTDKNVIAL